MIDKIQLMITCIIDSLYPEIGEAVVRVLNRAGVEVFVPKGQTCCGQPAFNAGMRAEARRMAIHTIKIFENTDGPVVIPSGSCCSMIQHSYLELFDNDKIWLPRAKALAARCVELTAFLVDTLGTIDLDSGFSGKLAYHASCHLLRELGVNQQPQRLLASIKNAQLVELQGADECCGFGGVFSVEHPEISAEMLNRKINNIQNCGAPIVVVCDAGCMININGGLHRRGLPQKVAHIAEILSPTNHHSDSLP